MKIQQYGLEIGIGAIVLLLICLFIITTNIQGEQRLAFMEACMEDLKEYECTAMWRSGDRSTQVVPVVISR